MTNDNRLANAALEIASAKLGPSANLLLTRLQAYRQAADYAYVFDIDEDDARRELEAALAFVEAAAAPCASASP